MKAVAPEFVHAKELAKQWAAQIKSSLNTFEFGDYCGVVCDVNDDYGFRISARLLFSMGLPEHGVKDMIAATHKYCKQASMLPAFVIAQNRKVVTIVFSPDFDSTKMFDDVPENHYPVVVVTDGVVCVLKMEK